MESPRTNLESFFKASSVAVIGASPRPETPGGITLELLLNKGYEGELYCVNPRYDKIGEKKCYASITEVPGAVELAILAIAAKYVLPVLKECVAKGVKGVIIYTSGFAETGDAELKNIQEEMQSIAVSSGMRIMGPNCVGLVNNNTNLWATFASPPMFEAGYQPNSLGIISQSGFFGIAIYQLAAYNGVGFRYFASVGNQTDLSFTDFFSYMVDDGDIGVVCGYLEGLKEEEDILPVARRALSKGKPVVLIKVGTTDAGSRAASSHTGAMVGQEENYATLFKQTGIARASDFEQLMAFLYLSLMPKPPQGRKVAIVSVSGGAAVMIADKCDRGGLQVADLAQATIEKLDEMLPSYATSANPLDLTGRALEEPELFGNTLEVLLGDPGIDTVIVSFHISPLLCWMALAKLRECYHKTDKSVIIMGQPLGDAEDVNAVIEEARRLGIPIIRDMNYATWALSSYLSWLEKSRSFKEDLPLPGKGIVPAATNGTENLPEYLGAELLKPYDIKMPTGFMAKTAIEAGEIAERLNFPVVLKVQSPAILHKTEAAGVHLNINSTSEAMQAYKEIMLAAKRYDKEAEIAGVLVQEMLAPGQEIIVGMKRDKALGPVIMFGLGGVFVEVLEDVSLRLAPLTSQDALEMVQEIKGYKILQGYRGSPPCDTEAIVDLLLKVSKFAVENPAVQELDLNPVFVYPVGEGVMVADVLMVKNVAILPKATNLH